MTLPCALYCLVKRIRGAYKVYAFNENEVNDKVRCFNHQVFVMKL